MAFPITPDANIEPQGDLGRVEFQHELHRTPHDQLSVLSEFAHDLLQHGTRVQARRSERIPEGIHQLDRGVNVVARKDDVQPFRRDLPRRASGPARDSVCWWTYFLGRDIPLSRRRADVWFFRPPRGSKPPPSSSSSDLRGPDDLGRFADLPLLFRSRFRPLSGRGHEADHPVRDRRPVDMGGTSTA